MHSVAEQLLKEETTSEYDEKRIFKNLLILHKF